MTAFKFVLDDAVVEFFAERTKREREQLLRIFRKLAENPHQKGEWILKTAGGWDLQVSLTSCPIG